VHPSSKDAEAGPSEEERKMHHANRLIAGLTAASSGLSESLKGAKAHMTHLTGIGFGHREDGAPSKRKSGKASQWGAHAAGHLEDKEHHPIPPLAIRAMERLHMAGYKTEDIADMFAIDEKLVNTAVALRGNFEVIWVEAVHFLQPAHDPFFGQVKESVQAPASQQVRGADDHGYIGDVLIDLAPSSLKEAEAKAWTRRIRKEITRPKGKKNQKNVRHEDRHAHLKKPGGGAKRASYGETDVETEAVDDTRLVAAANGKDKGGKDGKGEESSGILIEMIVEIRQLQQATCQLEPGQHERSPEELKECTKNSGVRITKA